MDIVQADPLVGESTSDTTPTENADSLADHESQFNQPGRVEDGPLNPDADPDEIPKTPANTGQFANRDGRHRASAQRATPEDVVEINKLTKELRELETKVADRDPDAKAAPRLRTLKRQIAALRALDAPPEPKPVPRETPRYTPPPSDDKEPAFEDFSADPGKYPDPLAAWMKATARYEARQERQEESRQREAQSQQAQDQQEIMQWHQHQADFRAQKPDYAAVAGDFFQRNIGEVLVKAIVKAGDKGPAFVYHLAQHPELADELILLTHGKPVEDAFVATMQRRLTRELGQSQAAPTRSAVPATPTYTPPPPPNLVRTGPIKSEDELPGDESSLADHERAFSRKRR